MNENELELKRLPTGWVYAVGTRVVLAINWSMRQGQYISDRGETLAKDWDNAKREARRLAEAREKKRILQEAAR